MIDSQLISIGIITILAVISPGPDFALTLRSSLHSGRYAGLMSALGIACGVSIHISYTVWGMGYILTDNSWLLEGMKYGGAAYLIWLGIQSFFQSNQAVDLGAQNGPDQKELLKSFRHGFICNAVNPKTALFFLALFSQVVSAQTPISMQIGLGIFIAFAHLVWFSIVALLLTNAGIKDFVLKFKKWLERLTGICLLGLGVKLIIHSF